MLKSKFVKNILFGVGGQLIIIVLGIIVPRIMIDNYGSDVNGLISTVIQIFTYMALLEAGIGQAAKNLLYKPINEKDREGVSFIASVARSYFRKFTVYYAIGVVILSVVLPFVLKTNVGYFTVFLIVLFEGMSEVVSFYFIQTQTVILAADGRGYVNNGVNVVNKVLSYTVKIVMAMLGVNIAFLQFIYFLITVAKSVYYRLYFKRNYPWLNYTKAPSGTKLKDRNSYIITEIAWAMFSSTDMIVLSMFISTQISSVYGIYNMVFTNLNVLLNAVYTSVNYTLGQTFHEDKEKYKKLHDAFTSIFMGTMTILMCIAYVMILPFVKLYTKGVTDVNYIYEYLPVMFCLVQIISWSRYISGNLTALAGYVKQTSRVSLIEALTNIVLSIVLVHRFGLIGVLAATVIALPLKVIYCTYLSDKKILNRSCWKTISILGINYLFFAAVVIGSRFINIQMNSWGVFLKYGVIVSIIMVITGITLNILVNRDCLNYINRIKK